jgi:hypothetical protein
MRLVLAPASPYIRGGALAPSAIVRSRLGQATRRGEPQGDRYQIRALSPRNPVRPDAPSRPRVAYACATQVDWLWRPLGRRPSARTALDRVTRRLQRLDAAAPRRAGRTRLGTAMGSPCSQETATFAVRRSARHRSSGPGLGVTPHRVPGPTALRPRSPNKQRGRFASVTPR